MTIEGADQGNDSTNKQALAIFYAKNVTGGADTVTATFGASSSARRIIVHEYSGADPSSPIDQHALNATATGTTATDNITSGNVTTTVNGDLIFGAVVSTSTLSPSPSAGTGETARQSLADMVSEDKQQVSTGSIASTWTFGVNSVKYHGAIVAIRPAAAVQHVQSASTTSGATTTTIAQAFTSSVTGGHLIVVAVSWDTSNTQTVTVTDSQSNTYTKLDQGNDSTNHQALAVFYAKNVTGGSDTVTATFGAASQDRRIAIHEYAGAEPSSPIDQHTLNATATGTTATGTTATDNITSGNVTTTVNGDLIFGAVNSTSTGSPTASAGTGETARQSLSDLITEDKQQVSAGSIASTRTFGVNSVKYHAAAVAIRPASGGSGSQTFGYDLANDVASAATAGTTTTYTYDGDGTRLQASTGPSASQTTNFLWDSGHDIPQLALERDGSNTLLRRYIYGSERLALYEGGASYYYHYDPIGSVRNVTNGSGTSQWTYAYEPYGTTRIQTNNSGGAPANPFMFAGEYDDPTGLYALRARQYDPLTGRFLGQDPLEQDEASLGQDAYVYADAKPTTLVDPTGEGSNAPATDGTNTANVPTTRDLAGVTTCPIATVKQREDCAFAFLRRHSLTMAQSAGVIGNLWWESRLVPTQWESRCTTDEHSWYDGNCGVGIGQWTPSKRKQALLKFAGSIQSVFRFDVQLNYLWWELNTGNLLLPFPATLQRLKSVR